MLLCKICAFSIHTLRYEPSNTVLEIHRSIFRKSADFGCKVLIAEGGNLWDTISAI